MIISSDSQVMIMLCSHLGLPADPNPTPLTLRDWNPLARKLQIRITQAFISIKFYENRYGRTSGPI